MLLNLEKKRFARARWFARTGWLPAAAVRERIRAAAMKTGLSAAAAALLGLLAAGATAPRAAGDTHTPDKDAAIAQSLAEMLRDARTVISNNEDLINNPDIGDKHLGGRKVLSDAEALYRKDTGSDPSAIDPASYQGRLMRAMMDAIVQVTDENQVTINEKGTGFKGFIPAVYGRLVSETFNGLAKGEAEIKVTAPVDIVRNRKALPDAWETMVINTKLLNPNWPHGQPYSATVAVDGKEAYRFAVPEYYTASCLACHGTPKGALDITGYPKEGRKLGDLGGVMSITLFR